MSSLIANNIEEDTRFLKMIDDPSSINLNVSISKCILSIPILTSEENNNFE
jgi:hypothetical protein